MRRCLSSLVVFMLSLVAASAQHRMDTVQVCVLLHPDGHAYVQEERVMDIGDEGTECYISFNNMNGIGVTLINVSDERGEEYIIDDDWILERSREEKAGHCGLMKTDNGHDLCWGVGTSGRHKYVIHYELSHLVKSYTDADGFNHCFYEAATPAAKYASVYIIPYSERFTPDSLRLTPETARIWAFGFHGHLGFYSGNVAAYTLEPMCDGDKIIIMMEFPKGIFSLSYNEESTFSDIKKAAFFGSDYNIDDENDGAGKDSSVLGGDSTPIAIQVVDYIVGGACCCGLPMVLLLLYFISHHKERRRAEEMKQREKNIPYRYTPPASGSLVRAQQVLLYTLYNYGRRNRMSTITQRELLNAFILRMLYTGRLELTPDTDAKGRSVDAFRISEPRCDAKNNKLSQDEELINDLHRILYEASGDDNILQPDELRSYIKIEKNALRVRPYARRISNLYYGYYDIVTSDIEINAVYGFYKYLRDFTLLPERHIQEVALWQEYMVFAALYDLTDQVVKDLRRINPDVANLDDITLRYLAQPVMKAVSSFSSAVNYSMTKARHYQTDYEIRNSVRYAVSSRSYDSGSSYDRSSGRGGSSSYSGGGGHSGGGGSGVR